MATVSPLNYLTSESYPVALYDMDIEDVQERSEKRLYFFTSTAAANFLGYTPAKMFELIGRGRGHYAYRKESKTVKKKYAVRKITHAEYQKAIAAGKIPKKNWAK